MLIRHSFIYFLGRVAPAVLSILGVMIYTRIVTPKAYGLYSLVIVLAGLVNIFGFQWIRSSLIRFYNERENVPSFCGTILYSHIMTVILIGIISFIISIILYFQTYNYVYIIFGYILVILQSSSELLTVYFRTKLQPKIIMNVNIFKTIFTIIFSTVLIYLGIALWGLLIGALIGWLFSIVLYIWKIDNNIMKNLSTESNKNTKKKFLIYGLPITLSFALSVALQNIDKIMISSILGLEANGNYSVSFDLIHNLIYMIMMSISLAGFPIILKVNKEKGEKAGKSQFVKYSELLFFISIPACFGLAAILNEFTSIVIGINYSISHNLMLLIIIASLFHGVKSYYYDLTLQISAKTLYFFIPALTAILLNIVLNFFMLTKFGIEGAAFATAVSFFVAMLISAFFSRNNYEVKFPMKNFLKITTSSIIMYLIVKNINIENNLIALIIKLLVGFLTYAVLSYAFNTIESKSILQRKLKG